MNKADRIAIVLIFRSIMNVLFMICNELGCEPKKLKKQYDNECIQSLIEWRDAGD